MLFQRKMLTMAVAGTLAACVGLNVHAADNSFPSNVVLGSSSKPPSLSDGGSSFV